ncbi:MAG: hypothetical protein AB1791_23680 [Chloroflexota bacterium]
MNTLEQMPAIEYEAAIEQFIEEAAQWDGSLPIGTFFEAWTGVASRQLALEIQAQVKGDQLVLSASPDSPLLVYDNYIWLDDGRKVVIRLVTPAEAVM